MNLDLSIIIWIQELFGPGSRSIWEIITNLGSAPVLVLIVGMVIWTQGTNHGLRIFLSVMFSILTVLLLKVFILHPRPYYIYEEIQPWRSSDGLGMPSGHAAGAMGLWGTLAISMQRGWITALAVVLVLLIGLSRLYFGVHSPSQVLVGWSIGLAVVLAIWRWEKRTVAIFKSIGLWGQLGLALASTLLIMGVQTAIIADREANFEIPTQWSERYYEAHAYEAALVGETLTEFESLVLFEELDIDLLGAFFGMWLVIIYTAHRGGFGAYTKRQCVVNVALGLVSAVVLIGLIEVTKGIVPVQTVIWISLPIVLGIGVPLIGKRFA